jgi:hypothetical protein
MVIAALICALVGTLMEALAFFGVSPNGADLAILGLVFYGLTLVCMNLPPRVVYRS